MRLLVTNDDAFRPTVSTDSPTPLVADGHDVTVVVPTQDLSGSGASLGAPSPTSLQWDVVRDDPAYRVIALQGSVAMSVLFGASGVLGPGRRQSWSASTTGSTWGGPCSTRLRSGPP